MPGFGGDSLRRTLDTALGLNVQHISAYHLTIEPDTAFGRRAARGEFAPVNEAVSEAEYALVHETLTGAGFEHYEVSNFALPGFRRATTPRTGTARSISASVRQPTRSTGGNAIGTSVPWKTTLREPPRKPKR